MVNNTTLCSDISDLPATEGARRATGGAGRSARNAEVPVRPARRRLTVAYKLRVLQNVSRLKEQGSGAIGAYLRQEGLYYSSITRWQKQLEAGTLGSKTKRGKQEKGRQALLKENKALRRKMDRLEQKLHKTELIVELQKKISQLMDEDSRTSSLK